MFSSLFCTLIVVVFKILTVILIAKPAPSLGLFSRGLKSEENDHKGGFGDATSDSGEKVHLDLDCTCGATTGDSLPWIVTINFLPNVTTPVTPNSSMSTPMDNRPCKDNHHDHDHQCSGTLINDRVILTSASCLWKVTRTEALDDPAKAILFPEKFFWKPEEIRVNLENSCENAEIEEIFVHPLFGFYMSVFDKVDYDIALLSLRVPLELGTVRVPVCLPKTPEIELVGHEAVMRTFPKLQSDTDTISSQNDPKILMENVLIKPRLECLLKLKLEPISKRFLCLHGFPNLEDLLLPEPGDSRGQGHGKERGGAVLIKNGGQFAQYGIYSWRSFLPMIFPYGTRTSRNGTLELRPPLQFATNVPGFLNQILTFSKRSGAKWCKNGWNGLPKVMEQSERDLWEHRSWDWFEKPENIPYWNTSAPWKVLEITSRLRNVLKRCKCGIPNSAHTPTETSDSKRKGRIHHGEDATPYEYGWPVQLIVRTKPPVYKICGASIINDRILLTAAHCVRTSGSSSIVRPDQVEARVHRYKGPSKKDKKDKVIPVVAVIPHPDLVNGVYSNRDIALIVLGKPLDFPSLAGKVSPICLPETGERLKVTGREDATVVGWGRTDVLVAGSHPTNLQELKVKVISKDDCMDILEKYPGLSYQLYLGSDEDNSKICAGNFKKPGEYKDPASGDSGGPLFLPLGNSGSKTVTMVQIGVTISITMTEQLMKLSKKYPEADIKTVTFYTNVTDYLEFIDYYSYLTDALWCSR